jgi:radical SAM protein with 4Fe4S-binding SPASM domain
VHCYANKHSDDPTEKKSELSSTEMCSLLDELAASGCLWLLFTGGEPFVRDDLIDIYLYAKNKGFLISLFTNGTLLTPAIADVLQDLPPKSIEISLYGITRKTYERVTRSPGSYQKCMKGIDLLLERDLPLKLKTVVTTINKHEFADIKKFVQGLGLEFRFDALINERLDGSTSLASLRIPPREVVNADLTDPERSNEFKRLYERTEGTRLNPQSLFQCGAGLNSFHVDPHGQLMLCSMFREPSYDLRHGGFEKGWYEFLPHIREQKVTKESKCNTCGLASMCDQCPGWSQIEYGDAEVPVDYLCQIAHLRAEAFGIGGSE